MTLKSFVLVLFLFCIHLVSSSDEPAGCRLSCTYDSDCTSGEYYYNPCSYCERGACRPMCGVYCKVDSDCRSGGSGNPCTFCSNRNICVNPRPRCGSFCGGEDKACLPFGNGTCPTTSPENCCKCSGNWTKGCVLGDSPSVCGKVCTNSGSCLNQEGSKDCPECIGYHCQEAAKCGQNCISSGQCQNNPGQCISCIGTICSDCFQCGGECGGSDQCCPSGLGSCPVCGYAKCVTSEKWEEEKKEKLESGGQEELDRFLKEAETERRKVRMKDVKKMKQKLKNQGIYDKEVHEDVFEKYVNNSE